MEYFSGIQILQYFSEWFGTGTKTVDTDLQEQILMLKETQVHRAPQACRANDATFPEND